ncbi:hypothetical protein PFAG_01975 [Plasmodium falciparum Santa Lucia]|uniref:Duffy-binding-like domain-containing protein n=1 Tax=Plasmodium falciparum Santa Lucia TaxID=478859 RepID=W7FXM2_PLAFA|nr:hypothetical protein PFAG_01975 [Plasmodium falciparum Santa Lucia]
MAPGGLLGGGGGTQDDSVKDLFDRIGGTIQQQVHSASKIYTSELHGDLSKATYPGDENPEKSTPQDPCDLEHSLHTNVTIGGDKEYPCEKRSNVRFSDKEGAECNKSKIKDSKSNCGACAPYRRLHLCDRNLENINDYSKINTKDNLLLEVCLAAKYEGDSIIGEYPKYQNKYGDSGFTTCTMLARSFADIGDIVRGKDLYLGDNRKDREQKQKLQENLNKIFNDIKKNNQSKLGRLSLDQIREYWWEENREKIWKAITCKAQGYKYFLPKCSKDTWSQDKCRCANTGVPTNFDYVPQYLRWFEEWAEDFCQKHFDQQDNLEGNMRNMTLKYYLKELFEEKIKEAYGEEDSKELDAKLEEIDVAQKIGDTQHSQDAIKILLGHEEKEAKKCLDTHNEEKCKPKPKPTGEDSVARNLDPAPEVIHDEDDEESHHSGSDSEEEEEDEEDGDDKGDDQDTTQDTEGSATDTSVDVCTIVNTLFTSGDNTALKDACALKYGPGGKEKFPNWKCISDTTGGKDGAICIPPRRRKLYIGGLSQWASDETQSQSQETSGKESLPSGDKLLQAFIQTAAVETFFLWDRYKKEWHHKNKAQNGLGGEAEGLQTIDGTLGDDNNPEKQLQSGTIPPDFLRQMFYTLGDYRDICTGDEKVIQMLKANGDKNIEKIEDKIKIVIENSGSKPSRAPPVPQNSGKDRKTWWDENAKHIWEGMVCALSYDTDKTDDKKIKKNEQVETKLKEKLKKNGEQNGDYHYDTVTLKDEEQNGAKPHSGPMLNNASPISGSGEKTTLTDFISRPPYFRYLEEWGENFCKERKKRLENINEDCMDGDTQKYSGDGEHCETILSDKYDTVPSLGSSCPKSCSSYRKWIRRKKYEFTEQQNAFTKQKEKCQTQSNGAGPNNDGKGFCETLQRRYNDTAAFLDRLKSGPCKTIDESEKDNGEDKLDFSQPKETFKPAKNCKPCSKFKVKCENGDCSKDKRNECTANNKKHITANRIKDCTQDFDILVSDNDPNGFNGLEDCENAHIFKGIRKEQWTCGKVCGYKVCKPKTSNGNKNDEGIIIINALLRRWLQYFLEDYNKIKHKISHCTKNGEGFTCINGCVDQWIKLKKVEWKNIKERFIEQYKNPDNYNVRSVLEEVIPENHLVNAKNKVIKLSKFDTSCGCSFSANTTNGNDDAIDCMITKLQKKIEECQSKHSGSPEQQCQNPSATPDDEDLFLEEEEENTLEPKKMMPTFCDMEDEKPKENEGTCEEAVTPSVPEASEVKKKEKEKEKQEEGEPSGEPEPPQEKAPAPAPAAPPPAPLPPPSPLPPPADQPFDPTILQTTIPFGIAIALTSIVMFGYIFVYMYVFYIYFIYMYLY